MYVEQKNRNNRADRFIPSGPPPHLSAPMKYLGPGYFVVLFIQLFITETEYRLHNCVNITN